MIWVVTYEYGRIDAPELDILDVANTGGKSVPGLPHVVSDPKRLPLTRAPSEPVFRVTGYPWVVLATDEGRELLATRQYQGATRMRGLKFKRSDRIVAGTIPVWLLDPWAIHERAAAHNWDDGYRFLEQILSSMNCERATAVMLFWLGEPEFFQQYAEGEYLAVNGENFAFVQELQREVLAGKYPEKLVSFDPRVRSVAPAEPGRWAIAPEMMRPCGPSKAQDGR